MGKPFNRMLPALEIAIGMSAVLYFIGWGTGPETDFFKDSRIAKGISYSQYSNALKEKYGSRGGSCMALLTYGGIPIAVKLHNYLNGKNNLER